MFYRIVPITALLALLAGCMGSTQSGGESAGRPMNTPTAGEIAEFLKSQGHGPKMGADDSGSPMLTVNEDGDNFILSFYDCTTVGGLAARRCTGVEFSVSYQVKKKPTLSRIHELNMNYRMAKAYLDSDGNPGISMAVNTGGGFNSGNLRDSLEWWTAAMRAFENDIGWN